MRPALLILTVSLALAAAPQGRSEPFVPIGVWYGGGPARAPRVSPEPGRERDAWRRDLHAIRALGFNSIRAWAAWADVEPEPGRYRFEALDQLLALAREADLKVILQVFTEPAPPWILERYPDAAVVTSEGRRAESAAPPRVCLDHEGARSAAAAFIRAAAARAAASPAFFAIDVGSEPALAEAAPLCYCPSTARRFRDWLELRYRTLDALRVAWSQRLSSWDDVAPARERAATGPPAADWDTFAAVNLREELKLKADAASPRGFRPVSTHAAAPAFLLEPRPGSATPDDWWMASTVDQYGTAIAPKPAGAAGPWPPSRLAAALDAIRSAARDRGWWVARVQADAGVSAADLRLWGWAALARGAGAITYDALAPSAFLEGIGPDRDGARGRARAAGVFAEVVARNPQLFAPLRPRPSRVALVYNHPPVSARDASAWLLARDSMLGFHRALFEANVQVDFIHPDEVRAGLASTYAAIVLSDPEGLDEGVARTLQAYVQGGGTLISEARPAARDDRGRPLARVPGFGLDAVFGARETSVRTAERTELTCEPGLDGALAPLAGRRVAGLSVAERLEVTGRDVRILARYSGAGPGTGEPAVVMAPFGAGRAILIGTLAAAAFERNAAALPANGELIQRLLASVGIGPEIRVDGGAGLVEARLLESSDALVIVAINHADTAERVTLEFGRDMPEAIWQNMETGSGVDFVLTANGPRYTRTFAPRDAIVLVIHKSKVRRW